MLKALSLAFCLLVSFISHAASLRVVFANLEGRDPETQFSFAVLRLALEKSGMPFELVRSPVPMTDARTIIEIQKKSVDVAWLGNSAELETTLLPVMIPISRGLLGYRIALIRADQQDSFSSINSLAELKRFKACLGVGWPIGDAWTENDLQVTAVPQFESLFKMTQAGRADYIPIGAGNIHSYLNQFKKENPDLAIERHLVVVYPFYDFFFFVNKDNKYLRDLIDAGIKKAYADGSYNNLFLTHPEFAGLKDLKLDRRTRLDLKNIHATAQDLAIDRKYWLNTKTPFAF